MSAPLKISWIERLALPEDHVQSESMNGKNLIGLWALFAGVLCLAAIAGTTTVQAQLAIEMQLAKKVYVSYEPIVAQVNVYNRSGRDVVLGGPGGTTWLRFQVKDSQGNLLSPGERRIAEKPVLVKAGDRITRTVDLTTFYPVYHYGTYKIRASVYLPALEKFYESEESSTNVSDGKQIWDSPVGAPIKFPGGGTRRFVLLTYRGEDKTELYMRLVDEDTGGVFATYSLGSVILFHRPQAVVDSEGQLNVLFLAAPQLFAHSVVGYDGKLLHREVYKAAGFQRPVLTMADGGAVQVRGGRSDRTDREAGAARVRDLSDRPQIPGLGL